MPAPRAIAEGNSTIGLSLETLRDRLFGGTPTSYEICTLVHRDSDTRINIEVSGVTIRIDGSQGRPGGQRRTDIREQILSFSNGLEAARKYQELVGEHMDRGYGVAHAGPVALRVADRIDEIRAYLAVIREGQRRSTNARLRQQPRDNNRVVALMQSLLQVATPETPPPPPPAEARPAEEPRPQAGVMSKLGGKRKLLRE